MSARKMRKDKYTFTLTEKQVLYYRTHVVDAALDLLGVELTWFQRIILRTLMFTRFPLLNLGRGIGKTYIMAIAACLTAMLYPKIKIGIIAPVFRQANYVFDYIDELWGKSDYLKASTVKVSSRGSAQSVLKFTNGAYIEALPVGDGNKIRGRRYNLMFIDEYAQMSELIIRLVIRPMLNIKQGNRNNRLVVASTSYYRWNHYWNLYVFYLKQMVDKNTDYVVCEFDYVDVMNTQNSPYTIDEEILKMQKEDMTEEQFLMENACLFPSDSVGFISAKLLDSCTPKQFPIEPKVLDDEGSDAKYVIGVDAARSSGGDNFAITLLEIDGHICKVVAVQSFNGVRFQDTTSAVKSFVEKFNVILIVIGSGGGGSTVKDLLAEEWVNSEGEKMLPILDMDDELHAKIEGLRIVKMVSETAKKNSEMYMQLKAHLQQKKLLFPLDVSVGAKENKQMAELYKQISSLKKELLVLEAIPQGMYHKFEVPSKYKKDRATSLVLALDGIVDSNKSGRFAFNKELAVGFFV